MVVASSLYEANVFFVFKRNGTEAKVLFKDNKLTVLSGFLYEQTKELAIRKIKEIN